jgi:hypothetical protein
VRARMVTAPSDPTKDLFSAGVEGVLADGTTLRNTAGANSISSQHYFAASNFDFGGVTLGDWVLFRGYLTGFNTSTNIPSANIANPSHMYDAGITYMRPVIVANFSGGNGIMEVDYIQIEKVETTSGIAPNAVFDVESFEDDSTSLINGGGVVLGNALTELGLVEGYLLQATATFDIWITNTGGGTPEFYIEISGNSGSLGVSQSAFPVVSTSPGQRITLQCEVPIELADEGGAGLFAHVVWTGAQPAGTAEMRNGALRVEKCKR